MQVNDWISLIAICVAILSALYARRAVKEAYRANEIAMHNELIPYRLAVYNSMKNFLKFCFTYRTMQSLGKVKGTRDLVAKIGEFKGEVDQHGPLSMPEVEKKIEEILNKAWQFQRVLDRLAGPDPKPIDSAYSSAEDNMDGLNDWFASEEKESRKLFEPYLKLT
jgi:hypothetical protein